ncbi:replication initiator protein [Microviridae sp.]|nr:replication initiator protein [Microviridae sp.]
MPCFRPIEAWRTTEDTPNGKKAIVFQKSARSTHSILLPCGQCIGCRLAKSQEWAIRCVHEAQSHTQNSFITLTYNDEHLPSDGSLIKSHFTDFMRKLRYEIRKQPTFNSKTVRFFMCGEYGENFSRPHYHACLFGIDFPDKEIFRESEGIITWQSELLTDIWGYGFTTTGELNFHTAAYTARYITKKITGDKAEDYYQTTHPITGDIIDLQPEYANMSRMPGVGKNWYKKYTTDVFPSDFLIHDNKKIKVPRYYEKLYDLDEGDIEELKLRRNKKAARQLKNNTPERLHVREKLQNLKFKQLSRSYENEA